LKNSQRFSFLFDYSQSGDILFIRGAFRAGGEFMKFHEFMGQVQSRAKLANTEDAIKVTKATLQTLGERLHGGEPKDLASQLPREIGVFLQGDVNEKFGIDEFFRRVSEREGSDLPLAIYHSRVVVEVVKEAVSKGEIDDIKKQLPPEYDRLFEAGSAGRM
jgi:uncharacterized protein (DUF2267 family)